MDANEDIEYKEGRADSVKEDQWALEGTVSAAGLSDTESENVERPEQNLLIVPKREEKYERPRLKATMWEILCFLRVYSTTICKAQIITLGEDDINRFFWYRVSNLIFSSMPHVFVQVFLAAYVPDDHFYLTKMNPLTCGNNFIIIMAAIFELVLFTNSNVLLIDFFWQGLFKKSPWKRQRIDEKNRARYGEGSIFLLYYFIICILVVLHYNKLFKKFIWKVLKYAHYAELVFTCLVCIYIYMIDETIYEVSPKSIIRAKVEKRFLIDIDYLSILLNAPPLAQILISRSTKDHSKIAYESLSSLLVFSNWIYGILTALTAISLKHFCKSIVGVTLHLAELNSAFFFYLYPIFFSRFFIGNIMFSLVIFAKFLADFYTFLITHHCVIEAIVCEWKFIPRIFAQIGVALTGTLVYTFIPFDYQTMLYMYSKIVAIFIEVLGIYCLYPIDRLIEDMTFHRGSSPNSLRIWSLRLVVLYVFIKLYTIVEQTNIIFASKEGKWFWIIPVSPLVIGFIYKILHTLVRKLTCQSLIVPTIKWGPVDYVIRYCRKLYKIDEYIGSQAERVLSRYMLSKTESEVVHLDIQYDPYRRSALSLVKYEDEKKNV